MKLCPECQADVEGLIDHCDCCGVPLNQKPHFFTCFCHDFPECLGFSNLAFEIAEQIEPKNPNQYGEFLENIALEFFCYPDAMIAREKIKNRVMYSAARKFARVTMVVEYSEFVFGDREEKAGLVASALQQGLNALETRLLKSKCSISEVIKQAGLVLGSCILRG